MFPTHIDPQRHYPAFHFPLAVAIASRILINFRTRRLLRGRWNVVLESSAGTEYDLGIAYIPVSGFGSVKIPASVPDGSYKIKITTTGDGWRDQVSRSSSGLVIDRSSSSPIQIGMPLLSNFRYELDENHLTLLWDGDVSESDSGLVSAGIWLSDGAPDFGSAPSVTVPLFSENSTHRYEVGVGLGMDGFDTGNDYTHAGLAPYSATGARGGTSTITLPDLKVLRPTFSARNE